MSLPCAVALGTAPKAFASRRSGYNDPVKSSPMEKAARKVIARLRENGHIAYFAGGCVRDMVRGLTPKDYDIVPTRDRKPCRRFLSARSQSARILA